MGREAPDVFKPKGEMFFLRREEPLVIPNSIAEPRHVKFEIYDGKSVLKAPRPAAAKDGPTEEAKDGLAEEATGETEVEKPCDKDASSRCRRVSFTLPTCRYGGRGDTEFRCTPQLRSHTIKSEAQKEKKRRYKCSMFSVTRVYQGAGDEITLNNTRANAGKEEKLRIERQKAQERRHAQRSKSEDALLSEFSNEEKAERDRKRKEQMEASLKRAREKGTGEPTRRQMLLQAMRKQTAAPKVVPPSEDPSDDVTLSVEAIQSWDEDLIEPDEPDVLGDILSMGSTGAANEPDEPDVLGDILSMGSIRLNDKSVGGTCKRKRASNGSESESDSNKRQKTKHEAEAFMKKREADPNLDAAACFLDALCG